MSEPTPAELQALMATMGRMVETFEKMTDLLEKLTVVMEMQGKLLRALSEKAGKRE